MYTSGSSVAGLMAHAHVPLMHALADPSQPLLSGTAAPPVFAFAALPAGPPYSSDLNVIHAGMGTQAWSAGACNRGWPGNWLEHSSSGDVDAAWRSWQLYDALSGTPSHGGWLTAAALARTVASQWNMDVGQATEVDHALVPRSGAAAYEQAWRFAATRRSVHASTWRAFELLALQAVWRQDVLVEHSREARSAVAALLPRAPEAAMAASSSEPLGQSHTATSAPSSLTHPPTPLGSPPRRTTGSARRSGRGLAAVKRPPLAPGSDGSTSGGGAGGGGGGSADALASDSRDGGSGSPLPRSPSVEELGQSPVVGLHSSGQRFARHQLPRHPFPTLLGPALGSAAATAFAPAADARAHAIAAAAAQASRTREVEGRGAVGAVFASLSFELARVRGALEEGAVAEASLAALAAESGAVWVAPDTLWMTPNTAATAGGTAHVVQDHAMPAGTATGTAGGNPAAATSASSAASREQRTEGDGRPVDSVPVAVMALRRHHALQRQRQRQLERRYAVVEGTRLVQLSTCTGGGGSGVGVGSAGLPGLDELASGVDVYDLPDGSAWHTVAGGAAAGVAASVTAQASASNLATGPDVGATSPSRGGNNSSTADANSASHDHVPPHDGISE